jgi:Fe-S oxidoreductase
MSEPGVVPVQLMSAVNKQMAEGSPLGMTEEVWDSRLEWVADEWEVDIPRDVKGADSLVVFSSIEVMKFPGNVAAIAQIMNTAGERWTVSSVAREVVNFGFYEGNEGRTVELMGRIFEGARQLGVKRIVVTECGHAYDALRWTAANLMEVPAGLDVTHIVAVMADFVKAGRIKLKPGANDGDGIITFHDACKIQRRGGHIEEPRELLRILAPNAFREMTPNREEAVCCGGGGGVIAIKSADPQRYAVFQMKERQIRKAGAQTVAMTCSNCRLQFTDGVEHFGSDLKVAGLAQMVAGALVE